MPRTAPGPGEDPLAERNKQTKPADKSDNLFLIPLLQEDFMTKVSGDLSPLPLSVPTTPVESAPPPATAAPSGSNPASGGQVGAFQDAVVPAGADDKLHADLLGEAAGATEMGWNPVTAYKSWVSGKVLGAFKGLLGGVKAGGEAIGKATQAVDDAVRTVDKGLKKVGLGLGQEDKPLADLADKMRQVQAEADKRFPGMTDENKKQLNEEFRKNMQKAIQKDPNLIPKELQNKTPKEIDFKTWDGKEDPFKDGADMLKVKDGDGSSSLRA